MKPKHYPHITLAAAIAMMLLPAAMLLLISSPKEQSIDELIAAADSDRTVPSDGVLYDSVPSESGLSATGNPAVGTPSSAERAPTRIAMLSSENRQQAIALDTKEAVAAETTAKPFTALSPTASHQAADDIMRSAMIETQPTYAAAKVSPSTDSEVIANESELVETSVDTNSKASAANDQLDQELNDALAKKTETDASHFDSTGHLAMSGRINQSSSIRSRNPRSARSPKLLQTDSKAAMSDLLDEDPFASDPKAAIVDIIIQQPSERRPVSKVENLIATTQQPGWPIALVRSDLPDDFWWVQQMVGIQNRSFASRVNFGNDNSIPGSVYHLVIVFLDSADEARRFRIAKQFKDLPEGLRRSREYTFVRK